MLALTTSTGSFPIIKQIRLKPSGRILIGIFNEIRNQYEVYLKTQTPMIVPQGCDEYDLSVAFAEAISELSKCR